MSQSSNFLGYESSPLEKALYSVIPAPVQDGATFISGQALAPQAIINASCQIESYDEETGIDLIAREAVHCVDGSDAPAGASVNGWLEKHIRTALDAVAVPVILGGDGTISLTGIKTIADQAAKGNQEISVLHIDAHADLNDGENGENNLTTMRQVLDMDYKITLCQVGVRSLSQQAFNMIADDEKGIDCYFMSDLRHSSDDDWQDDIVSALSSPVYVSIDLSAFDSCILPDVGNPEPGGLNWQQVTRLLKKVASHRRIAAFDVVELCPNDNSTVSNFTAARLVYKLMNYICSGGKMLEKN